MRGGDDGFQAPPIRVLPDEPLSRPHAPPSHTVRQQNILQGVHPFRLIYWRP